MREFLILVSLLFLVSCEPNAKTLFGPDQVPEVPVSSKLSTLTVSSSQVLESQTVTVTLRLKDESGVAYTNATNIIFSTSGGTSTGNFSPVTSLGNGVYTATFTGESAGTPTKIRATVNGIVFSNSLPIIKVLQGNYSLANSVISVSSSSVNSGSSITVTLTSKDSSDIQLADGGLVVTFAHTGGSSTGTFSAVTDHGDGTYSATFTGVIAGSATDIVATIYNESIESTSPSVTVNFGAATKLVFVPGPSTTASGAIITPAITVEVLDVNNNRITNYPTAIVMTIATNPSSGTLTGTLTRTPSSGVAIFNDLSINFYGTGYKLKATSGTLSVTSAAFNVTSTAFIEGWPFTDGTSADYVLSDSSKLEFIGNLVRFKPIDQIDSAAVAGTMSNGAANGVVIGTLTNSVSSGLKLGNDGTCNGATSDCAKKVVPEIYELHSSWTPQWGDLISYWKLNESSWNGTAGEVKDSRASHNGVRVGDANTTSNSKMGAFAGNFDGSGDYVDLGSYTQLDGATAVSVSAWIKPTVIPFAGWEGIFSRGSNATRAFALYGNAGAGYVRLSVGTATSPDDCVIFSSMPVTQGVWNHVVATWNGSSCYLYVNGQKSTNTDTSISSVLNTSDGFNNIGFFGSNNQFNGAIDDVAVWKNKALTTEEIETIYERQKLAYSGTFESRVMDAKVSASWTTLSWLSPLPFGKELPDAACSPGPTCVHANNETATDYPSLASNTLMDNISGLWHFNEGTYNGTVNEITDSSGNGNHGQATWGSSSGQNGKFKRAINLSTGAFSINSDFSADFTFSFWAKPNSIPTPGAYLYPIGINGSYNTNGFRVALLHSATWLFWSNESAGTLGLQSSAIASAGKWDHIVVTYNKITTEGKIYINGSLAQTSSGTIIDGGTTFVGGWINGYGNADISVDEVATWKKVLSSNEVTQLYQRGASRLKFQVRSCATDPCTTEPWQGPSGSSETYFSELNNNSVPLDGSGYVSNPAPAMSFSASDNQFFQYRTILESDSPTTALMPEIKTVSVDPLHFDNTTPTPSIYGVNGVEFSGLNAITESLGGGGCSSGIGYTLSSDKITWKYWSGSSWVNSNNTVTQSNPLAITQLRLAAYGTQFGRGKVYVKAYLQSDGTSECELDALQIGGNR
jgi:hypothetical protein